MEFKFNVWNGPLELQTQVYILFLCCPKFESNEYKDTEGEKMFSLEVQMKTKPTSLVPGNKQVTSHSLSISHE